ncbi:TrkH family potassium uptake protein [Pseudoflavonifractor sp. 60]|uniref:TrkH family potassium uptake protein n=1 Tax=Pseudoflavonifractor sp. 60 TaxID=2304576 RepID=UPI00136D7F51|nr:TrkH family potassium uptake protein [Pseudoflavonifractor sp. 60]NBI68066.1 TrkH family potassium uptake protein [Pseudoflavonifractor sp. 60]
MNIKLVLKLVGRVLTMEAAVLAIPLAVALLYREDPAPFLLSIVLVAVCGFALSALPARQQFFVREGFAAVGLIWIFTGLVGALPFLFCGGFASPIDCIFESCSGFTTTGSTILTDIEALPKGILFWRAFTHWLGGMGVLVLATAIVPKLGIRSHYLTQAETPGPVFSKLVPKQSKTSKILYAMYCTLTLVEVACLKIAGMPLYDSFIHAFSTAGTGGFSNRNASVGAYDSVAIDIIITVFMLLFSINFAVYFLVLTRKWKEALASDELRFFLGVVASATVILTVSNLRVYAGVGESLRYTVFQVASIISTTGFGTADFVLWPQFSQMIIVLLMFCGASAGSTGGGMKCSRVLILLRAIRREIHRITHPRCVEVVKLDGKLVSESTLHTLLVFLGAYVMTVFAAALVISLDGCSFAVSFSAALTCVSNVGPGLEAIGPSGNFAAFSGLSKGVMSLCMIIGRLEIFPILVLFAPSTWRKA